MDSIWGPPPGAPAALVAAWPAMCPPVRQRYAARSGSRAARRLALSLLHWQARRHLAASPPESTGRAISRTTAPRRPERSEGPVGLPAGAAYDANAAPPTPDARILAIQPDHLGAALLTTSAYRLIKEALPTAELTVLAGPWAEDVPRHCPAVDRVRTCRFPGFDRASLPGSTSPLGRIRRGLRPYVLVERQAAAEREQGYDVAINFHADFWWGAALAALAGVPHRLGYASPEAAPFLSRALPLAPLAIGKSTEPSRPHVVEQYLALARETLALVGRDLPADFDAQMAYEPTPEERGDAQRLWRMHDLDEASAVVAIQPAPGGPPKRWPPERFGWVIDHVAGRFGATVVLTGGPGDVAEARAIAAACHTHPVVLAGQTSVGVLAALFDRCTLVLGTDNGALHLASARRRPTLRLFGPTDAHSWGPWPPPVDASAPAVVESPRACAPCHRLDVPPWDALFPGDGVAYPCMQEITSDQVIAAVEMLWPHLV